MIPTLLNKLAIPLLIFIAGSIGGIFLQQRVLSRPVHFSCPKAPDCVCPKAELQGIDFEKIKGFKGTINLNQHYTVDVQSDSTLLIKAINQAVKNNIKRR